MDEIKTQTFASQKPGTLWLSVHILSTQQGETEKENFPIIENIIKTPAADVFSYPQKYCVMAC